MNGGGFHAGFVIHLREPSLGGEEEDEEEDEKDEEEEGGEEEGEGMEELR